MDIRKRFRDTVTAIPADASLAILHDTDADGICSAVIVAKALRKLGHNVLFLHDTKNRASLGKKTYGIISKKKISYLFTTDKAMDSNPAIIQQLEKLCTLIVFDHHHLENDITSDKTLLIKPQLFSKIPPSQYPTSKLVYDFFAELVDVTEWDWLSAAGVISDASYRTWRDFIDAVHRRHKVATPDPIFSSELAKVGQYITTATLYDEKMIGKIVAIVDTANEYKDILHLLRVYVEPVREEINKWIASFTSRTEHYADAALYWYEIESRFPVSSIVSTRLSMEDSHATYIVAERRGKVLALSLRRQDGAVNCINLVKAGILGIKNATGGGHIPAAGGQAPYSKKEEIKKKMLSYLRLKAS